VEAASAPRSHALRVPRPRRLLAALPDEKLVEYVQRGDATAFEVLYDRHSSGVLGFCRHMLGSAQDAEDAVQHAFIAAHADLSRHTGREMHFKAWLYTIARNRCLSVLRARRDQPTEQVEIVTDRLSDDVQQRDDLRALLADIHRLPDDQREALVLSEVGALSHTEIAEVIGCEVSKVKSLVFQARTALIDRRLARETSCEEIREQIATLRGGALRRSHLRHHIESCPGCSEYREQVRRQRAMMALALPVIPSAALKGHVMGAVGLGSGAAVAGTASVGAGLGLAAKSGLAKLGIAAAVAGSAAGTAAVVHNEGFAGLPVVGGLSSSGHEQGDAGGTKSSGSNSTTGSGTSATSGKDGKAASDAKATNRSASGTEHGFTPVPGGSNGAAARERAATLGNGNHTGITKTHTKGKRTRTRAHRRAHAKKVHVKKAPPVTRTPRTPTTPKAETTPRTQPAPKNQPAPKTQTTPQPAPTTEPPATTPETTPPPTVAPLTGTTGDKSVGKGKAG
jgi:RNA polymerase sigma factor (sigma-70 family)